MKIIQNLSEREKKLVTIALICIVIFIIYFFTMTSFSLFQKDISSKVNLTTSKFEKLQPSINKLKQLEKQKQRFQKLPNENIYEFIIATPLNLKVLKRDKPEIINLSDGQQVQIKYKSVSFQSLIRWLVRLHKIYGITVIKSEFNSIDNKDGYISADIILE